MTKEEAINQLIKKVYDYAGGLVIAKKDIKKVEQYYIRYSSECKNMDEFLRIDEEIKIIVEKLKSGKDEIDKQLKRNKALQPAVLAECVFIQTLAKILNLRSYIDLERTSFTDVPIELAPYVKSKVDTICAARYVYYNKKDYDTLIIQYGNPKAGDAVAVLYTNEILIEIKDVPALLMDEDLLYDEDGKIIITSELKEKYPNYIKYIETFNKKTSIIESFGRNYKLFEDGPSDTEREELLKHFFESSSIDVIITSIGKKSDLIAIKSSDINFVFPDGAPLIDISGSEIRTTGKNKKAKAFTPNYLEKVLIDNDVFVDANGICRVYRDNTKIIGKTHGRGKAKNEFTRLKISHPFFVEIDDVIEYDNYDEFPKDKIKQSKSGISLHIEIKKTKNEIKNDLYK